MARVHPIESKTVKKILDDLRNENTKESMRNLIMLEIGFYTGLRITNILELRRKDYDKKNKCIKVKQLKKQNNKYKEIGIGDILIKDLDEYCKGMKKEEVLIKISRVQAHRIIKAISKKRKYNIKKNIGTHSMRKTYGMALRENNSLDIVQEALGHESQRITLRYLGITDDTINKANENIKY